MVAHLCPSERSQAPAAVRDPGAETGSATSLRARREPGVQDAPVADWRGFHVALRRAALAATQTGGPLSLLLLEPVGRVPSGAASDADPDAKPAEETAGRIDRLAGEIATGLDESSALARYAEERLAVIMTGTDLRNALVRAEQIGRNLSSGPTDRPALPAIGVAQFRDDESLGHLIERATEALDRARSDGRLIVAAGPRARRRPLQGHEQLCPCGLSIHACLCGRL
jgi:hypothetical protein